MEKQKAEEGVKAVLEQEGKPKPTGNPGETNSGVKNAVQVPNDEEKDIEEVIQDQEFEPTAEFNKDNSEVAGGNCTEEKDTDNKSEGK